MTSSTTHISLFRPENGHILRSELDGIPIASKSAPITPPSALEGPCWLAWEERSTARHLRESPGLVFEQQRLPLARYLPGTEFSDLSLSLQKAIKAQIPGGGPWTTHVIDADKEGRPSLRGRAQSCLKRLVTQGVALESTLLFPIRNRTGAHEEPGKEFEKGSTDVLQVLLTPEGVWWSLTPRAALPSPFPAGISDLSLPPEAPARSYLKVAEALRTMGWRPKARERVIDLGAAPGGWSYAFLEQGCRVMAVDNGPMKIAGLDNLPGELTHLREDGIRFSPPTTHLPVDWMLSDMLVPPGVCLGLLKRWIDRGWMQRFIINMKIPQQNPLSALLPMQDYLRGISGLSWSIRQLYHDRREVTLMGVFQAPPRPTLAEGRKGREEVHRHGKSAPSMTAPPKRRGGKPRRGKAAPGKRR